MLSSSGSGKSSKEACKTRLFSLHLLYTMREKETNSFVSFTAGTGKRPIYCTVANFFGYIF